MKTKNETLPIIIEATKRLIVRHGCRGTTLSKIIDESGVSRGGIYHYVKGKDELFAIILKHYLQELDEVFKSSVQPYPEGNLEEPAKAIASKLFFYIQADESVFLPILFYFIGQDSGSPSRAVSEFLSRLTLLCEGWIQSGQAGNVIEPSLNPRETARQIAAYLMGIFVQEGKLGEGSAGIRAEQAASFIISVLRVRQE